MWTADNWKDYEVIDTCGGEKLERWGQYAGHLEYNKNG